jgi:hypothetical protein
MTGITLYHTTFNCHTRQCANRMMENSTILTTPQHTSHVCHIPLHPHHSTTFTHTGWTCGNISKVNGSYQYRHVITTVCYKNIMLHSLNFWTFLRNSPFGNTVGQDQEFQVTDAGQWHFQKQHTWYNYMLFTRLFGTWRHEDTFGKMTHTEWQTEVSLYSFLRS